MVETGFALFDTAIGRCGIAWGPRGIVGVLLPEKREQETRARLVQRFPDAQEMKMPAEAERATRAIVRLLRGEGEEPTEESTNGPTKTSSKKTSKKTSTTTSTPSSTQDLSTIALDMQRVPPFHRRVYELARGIAPGTTLSYGELATRLGQPGAARAVGQALGRNPFAIVVPCHRVLAAGGKVGGFSASGGLVTKLRLLSLERDHAPARDAGADGQDGDGADAAPAGAASQAFGYDPSAAIAHLCAADATLARLIASVGPFGMRVDRTSSLFAALAQAIVYQQLHGKAAATIFARVRALFPRAHEDLTADQIHGASDLKLRGAGLSRGKLLSLRDLAARTLAGELPSLREVHRLTDDQIIDRLTEVRGIGRWTVEMLLIFRLGRPDVLPVDDYGVRKGFAVAFRKPAMPSPLELAKRGERWKPYRSVASWYLWRAAERSKPTKQATKQAIRVAARPKPIRVAKTRARSGRTRG